MRGAPSPDNPMVVPDSADPPSGLAPMLATAGGLPPDDGPWAYEIKFDGVRVLGYLQHGTARFYSRNGNDITAAYPELQPLVDQVGPTPTVLVPRVLS